MEEQKDILYRYGDSEIRIEANGSRSQRNVKKKRKKPLIIFLSIIAGLLLVGMVFRIAGIMKLPGETGLSGAADIKSDYVGVLYVEGTIGEEGGAYNHEYLIDAIKGMKSNSSNKGMMLYVNTPGGGVYESDELYCRIKDYKEATGRPVYVYMASQATSGGYYISAPADKIIANRNCWTGSIGVTMGTILNISELLDKYGIDTETITSGDNKAMGSPFEKMTKEQRKIFESLIDDSYERFVDIVAEGRGLDKAYVKKIADGRIYTARQAKENKLIDEIADTYENAEARMRTECALQDAKFCKLKHIEEKGLLSSLIKATDNLSEATGREVSDIKALTELMEKNREIKPMYMCDVVK